MPLFEFPFWKFAGKTVSELRVHPVLYPNEPPSHNKLYNESIQLLNIQCLP